MGAIVLGVVFLLLIGLPIGVAFGLPSIFGGPRLNIAPDTLAVAIPFSTTTSISLLAIPYFVLAGQVMNDGGLMRRLIHLAQVLLGRLRGSLGYVTIAASAMLGAITGSSVATVAAIGTSMGEEMVESGYKRDYVAALIAACGLMGVLIPPSIPLIIYGALVGVSVGELFIATMVPGLIMVLGFMLVHRWLFKRVTVVPESADSGRGRGVRHSLWTVGKALPTLAMPVILLGGIYSGMFTPTEAAAVAALYGITLALVTRSMRLKTLPRVFYRAALPSAAILMIVAFASSFNRVVTLEQIPQTVAEFAAALTSSRLLFLLIVNVLLLLVGMFMETNSAVLLIAPLLGPAAMAFEVHPVHFGIILVSNIELGLLTPPMAANLYVAAKMGRSSLLRMLPYTAKFLGMAVVVILVITYVPALSTWHLN